MKCCKCWEITGKVLQLGGGGYREERIKAYLRNTSEDLLQCIMKYLLPVLVLLWITSAFAICNSHSLITLCEDMPTLE